jgi:hypothetical protein
MLFTNAHRDQLEDVGFTRVEGVIPSDSTIAVLRRAPPWWRDVPGQVDPEPGEPAILTEHGQRLVGLKPWSA